MDTPRKIGIAIVMIIPTVVFAGAIWAVFHSWVSIFVWVILMVGFTARLIGKLSSRKGGSQTDPESGPLGKGALS